MSDIPEDIIKTAFECAVACYDPKVETFFDLRDVIANAILAERERSRTALSEAEQRAKDAESNLNEEISHRKKLQAALLFWMPSVTEEIEISTNGRCGDDAGLLAGYDGPIDESCWGDKIIARVGGARRESLEEALSVVANEARSVGHLNGSIASIRRDIRALIPSEPHDAEGRE